MMLSDDELVLRALNAHDAPQQYHETLAGMNPAYVDAWRRAVGAVREALTAPVTPLAPGETVRIPDPDLADLEDAGVFATHATDGRLNITVDDSEVGITLALDATGAQALIDVARRWQAAQEGE